MEDIHVDEMLTAATCNESQATETLDHKILTVESRDLMEFRIHLSFTEFLSFSAQYNGWSMVTIQNKWIT